MAKIKYTAIVAEIRNSMGDTTYSRNRGGAYSKTKSIPANPSTSYQVTNRARWTAAATTWRMLSDAERENWISAVDEWKRKDIFGDARAPSGFSLFMRVNAEVQRVGEGVQYTPQLPGIVPDLLPFSVVAAIGSQKITVNIGSLQDTSIWRLVVRASDEVSTGINFFKNICNDIYVSGDTTDSEFTVQDGWAPHYGAFDGSGKIFFQLQRVNRINGQVGQKQTVVATYS